MSRHLAMVVTRWRHGAAVFAAAAFLGLAMTAPGQGQGNDVATLQVRIDQLEEQVRNLNGQLEGLQFQMTQMQALVERMQEDNEFRFQALEGGDSGESDAVTRSGGETPAGASPQDSEASNTQSTQETGDASAPTVIDPLAGDSDLMENEELGTEDNLYASDVFGEGGTILGPPEGALGSTPPSEPLDLSFDPDAVPLNNGDANAQFEAGYDAVVAGDYAFAENQFRQFIDSFPGHEQAPEATYWLGETLIERGAYGEAAEVLLSGFESYPTSTRAPDLLFNLGIALHGAGEFDTACRTYGEVLRRYPDSPQAFRDDVTAEQARAGC